MASTGDTSRTVLAGAHSNSADVPTGLVKVPETVMADESLSRKALPLYALLVRDRDLPDEELAARLNCTPKHVKKLMGQLVSRGHVEIIRTRNRTGRNFTRVLTGLEIVTLEKAS